MDFTSLFFVRKNASTLCGQAAVAVCRQPQGRDRYVFNGLFMYYYKA